MATLEDLVEIQSEPLDLTKYINHVRHPSAGAISTFSGTTRDHFHGRQVLKLEYEAYIPMAIRQMRSILTIARSRWSLVGVAAAHRIGTVPISEDSVFIAVSSVHRSDAILACHFIIDEIKASVPIWKKEVYSDGQVWKENSEFFALGDAGQLIRKPCCGGERRLDVEKQHAGMLNGHGNSVVINHSFDNSVVMHHSHGNSANKHHGNGNHSKGHGNSFENSHEENGTKIHQCQGYGNSVDGRCNVKGGMEIMQSVDQL